MVCPVGLAEYYPLGSSTAEISQMNLPFDLLPCFSVGTFLARWAGQLLVVRNYSEGYLTSLALGRP